MKEIKILFIINGLGLGNSTRCHAVISQLKALPNIDIDIIANNHSYAYFKELENFSLYTNLYQSGPLSYGRNDQLGFWSFFQVLLPNLIQSFKNGAHIRSIIKQKSYSLIVTDSDYSIIFWRKLAKRALAINNSSWIAQVNPIDILRRPQLIFQYFIEILDFLFHLLYFDTVLNPTLEANPKMLSRKIVNISPPVRPFTPPSGPRDKVRVLILTSVSSLGNIEAKTLEGFLNTASLMVVGTPTENDQNTAFRYIPNQAEIGSYFLDADVIVTNAGLSTISEILFYNKIGVLLPIPNHAEQYYNARTASQREGIYITNPDNLPELLGGLVLAPSLPRQRGLKSGSVEARDAIINLCKAEERSP